MIKQRPPVVAVNDQDEKLELVDIWEAHISPGRLHRAVSVMLTNDQSQVLVQRRSMLKPLWPICWSNAVCTHPYDGESYTEAAVRRLNEELGIEIEAKDLEKLYRFEYSATYNSKYIEHELDTVLVGKYQGEIKVNPKEVYEFAWMEPEDIDQMVDKKPNKVTPWFKMIWKSPEWQGWYQQFSAE